MSTEQKRPAVLVTGGSRGIGRGISVELARRGWQVGVNFTANTVAAEETLNLIRSANGTAELIQGDVVNASDRQNMIDFMRKKFGRLDALINNAGVAPEYRGDLLDVSESSYDRVLNINLRAPFFLSQLAAKSMKEQIRDEAIPCGWIINMSSVSAELASINRGEYCISKMGMSMMTRLFAARLANEKIFVHEVRPGIIATDMTGSVKEKYDKLIAAGLMPIRRWGEASDVARCVGAVLSGDFPYTTGNVFDVDGGMSIPRL